MSEDSPSNETDTLSTNFDGIKKKIATERAKMHEGDGDYCKKSALLTAIYNIKSRLPKDV